MLSTAPPPARAVINSVRANLAELGIVAPVGRNGVEELLDVVADPTDDRVPEVTCDCVAALCAQLRMLKSANPRNMPIEQRDAALTRFLTALASRVRNPLESG